MLNKKLVTGVTKTTKTEVSNTKSIVVTIPLFFILPKNSV